MHSRTRPATIAILVSCFVIALAGHAATRWSYNDQTLEPSLTNDSSKRQSIDTDSENGEDLQIQVPDLLAVFGSAKAIETVRNATTITAYRIPPENRTEEGLIESAIIGKPVDASPVSSQLRDVLLNPHIYGWNSWKGCGPTFGVRIQFATLEDNVDILFCFDCNILSVYQNGKIVAWGEGDFDSGREPLVKAVKALFPDDELIQSMTTPKTKSLGL